MIAIQWEDVIGVLQTCKPYLIALGVLWIAAIVVMIACMKVKKKSKKRMIRKYSALSMLVSLVVIVNMIVLGPMYAMINLTTVGGITSDETTEEAKEVAGQIAEEGMVLLENDGRKSQGRSRRKAWSFWKMTGSFRSAIRPTSTCSAGPQSIRHTAGPDPADSTICMRE